MEICGAVCVGKLGYGTGSPGTMACSEAQSYNHLRKEEKQLTHDSMQ